MSEQLHKEALEMALSLTCGALEKAGFEHIDNPADAIEVLATQRDELLAVLKKITEAEEESTAILAIEGIVVDEEISQMYDEARAAIAKVESK